MAPGELTGFAILSLCAVLLAARAHDAYRQARAFEGWSALLGATAREALAWFRRSVADHAFAIGRAENAVSARDADRLRAAVATVEEFAPDIREGLAALWDLSRAAGLLAPMPAVRPSAWASWRLRGIAGVATALHALLVTTAERMRLRVWVLLKALGLCRRWLRRAAWPTEPRWMSARVALADLRFVGSEAERTYEHVIGSLQWVPRRTPGYQGERT